MTTRFGKLALVLLATLMLVMTGCSSEVNTAAADKAAQNLLEITEESSDISKIMEAGGMLSVELSKLSPSEHNAWEKKWGKKFEEADIDM